MTHRRSRSTPRGPLARAAHLGLALVFVIQQSAWAAVITVGPGGPTPACSLVDAITAANTDSPTGSCPAGSAGADTVVLTGLVALTAADNVTDGANGLPSVTSDITVQGNGFTIRRDALTPNFRIFHVATSGTLSLEEVTILNGRAIVGIYSQPENYGGGIFNRGTLNLVDSAVTGSNAFVRGGGIHTMGGSVSLTNSTLSGNGVQWGGGLYNQGGTVTLTNSTVSGNTGTVSAGGISTYYNGTTTLTNTTVTGNTGGGLYHQGIFTVTTVQNSIVAANGGSNCIGTAFADAGGNFSDDASCAGFAAIVPGTDFDTTLAANGGPTQTHKLTIASVARDAAGACGLATDQRGVSRPQGAACDSGATEFALGTVTVGPGGPTPTCTLVDAIDAANDDADTGGCVAGGITDVIDTVQLTGDVTLTTRDNSFAGWNGLPVVDSDITLEGSGHTIARSAAPATPTFRILAVDPAGSLTLKDVTVSNGHDEGGNGGGIFSVGQLSLTNSTLSGNTTTSSGYARGGGLRSNGGSVTITNSTISGNSVTSLAPSGIDSAALGGGFYASNVTVTLSNSTVSGNTASAYYYAQGGGFQQRNGSVALTNSTVSGNVLASNFGFEYGGAAYIDSATATLTNSTVSGNSQGGIHSFMGSATLTNSVVANNFGFDCFGTVDGGGNFSDDPSCSGFASITPGTDFDTTLADNGGPTQTHALLLGSVAIDAAGSCGLTTDQRGVTRPVAACDSGAFELACGNGVVDSGEQCDDGNTADGDCCSATCQFQDALGVGGVPNCCSLGACQTGAACGAICFTGGAICMQAGGPGTPCTCELPPPTPESCSDVLAASPGSGDGTYTIDPDGAGGEDPFDAYCDMTFDGGGWTLIMASNGLGPSNQTASTSVVPSSGRYLPGAIAQALANGATQVHIRTAGLEATQSITSIANDLPIQNLRNLTVLNFGSAMQSSGDPLAEWTGPYATTARLWGNAGAFGYPAIYHAVNNFTGVHLTQTFSCWSFSGCTATDMEVYTR